MDMRTEDTKTKAMINKLASELADKVIDLVSEPCTRLESYEVAVPGFVDKNNKVTNDIIKFLEIMAFDMARVPKISAAANKVKELIDEKKNFSEYYKDAQSKKLKLKGSKCALAIMDDSTIDKDDSPYGCPIWFVQYVPRIKLFAIEIDKLREKAQNSNSSGLSDSAPSSADVALKLIDSVSGVVQEGKKSSYFARISAENTDKALTWVGKLNGVFEKMFKKDMSNEEKQKMAQELEKLGGNDFFKDFSNDKAKLAYLLNQEAKGNSVTKKDVQLANIVGEMYNLVSVKFKGTKDKFMEKASAYVKNTEKISPTLSEKFDNDVGKAYNKGSMSAKNKEEELLMGMIAGLLSDKGKSKIQAVINDWKKLEENYNKFKSDYLNDVKELKDLVGNNDENIVKYIDLKSNEFEKNVPNISKAPNMVDAYVIKLGSFCDWSGKFVDSFNITNEETKCAKKLENMKKTVEEAKKFLKDYLPILKKYLPKDQESNAKI